jgi:hypothetical protein
VFDTRRYFERLGVRSLSTVIVVFETTADEHYHAPLLVVRSAIPPIAVRNYSWTSATDAIGRHTLAPDTTRPSAYSGEPQDGQHGGGSGMPGETGDRQPVHTVRRGALVQGGLGAEDWCRSLASLDEYAPDAATFARVLGVSDDANGLAWSTIRGVAEKLRREPSRTPDRLEDGYGNRPDAEEDGHASRPPGGGRRPRRRTLPPFIGIRIKPLSKELHPQLRMDSFVTTLLARPASGCRLTSVTIPVDGAGTSRPWLGPAVSWNGGSRFGRARSSSS